MDDNTEQIDELSQASLGKYVKKATASKGGLSATASTWRLASQAKAKRGRLSGNRIAATKAAAAESKLSKRNASILTAKRKMAEDTEVDQEVTNKFADLSKTELFAKLLGEADVLSKTDMSKWLEQALALIGHYADKVPDGAAAKNKTSVEMKGDAKSAILPNMKEDVAELFGSEQLSEEFKTKALTLFEAAIGARVKLVEAELEQQYVDALEEQVEQVVESTAAIVDRYVDRAVDKFMIENEFAIENTLRTELADEFIGKLRDLFSEHYVQLPEKTDAVEALAEKIKTLEKQLNDQILENMQLADQVDGFHKEAAFADIAEGLALTQRDKLRTLAEGISADTDADTFKSKLEVIKEHHFGVKKKPSMLNERFELSEEAQVQETVYADPDVRRYADAISRTLKR